MEPNLDKMQNLILKKDYSRKTEQEYLSSIIKDLYISLNPKCPKNYKFPKNFENLILRILSTNFSVIKNDEMQIVNSLNEKVKKISKNDIDKINRFQNLYFKLSKKRTLTKRWGVLYLLNHFSKNCFKALNFSITNELQQNFLNDYNNTLNNRFENLCSENNMEDYNNDFQNNYILSEKKGRNQNCKEKCEYYLNNLSPISDINEKFCENESQINHNNKRSNLQYPLIYPLAINPSKTSLTITEKDIINDLIYVFEGINSKYISYDERKDAFILNKLMPWSEEIYNIVNSLSELGWLYKKIKSYLDLFKKGKETKSQFIQSFIYAVQKELDEYFKFISFCKKMNNNNKRGNKLNLKKLFLWTLEPKEKLKWIATSCETTFNLKRAAIFSQIYSLNNYLGQNSYLKNILNEVSKPFLTFVTNWIKYGELEDPYKEFFVEIIDGISDDDIWNLKYQLIAKNVPNFMKREKIIKIFEVGKCIHFMRNYCNEKFNLSNLKDNLNNLINDNNKNLSNTKENKIELDSLNNCYEFINYLFDNSETETVLDKSLLNLVNENIDLIHKLINEEIVKLIFNKFKFNSNLESINKYLLLGQGDMMQTLIESLFEELDKPANTILIHNLESCLENAIKASNSDIKDPENIKKLNVILLNSSQGDLGWDIFCLEYNVQLPLKVIFSSKLLKDYLKIFLFFWKIKRIKYGQINHLWKKIKNINYNSNKNNTSIKKLIRTSIIFNQEIVHFITNLHNYFSLEVLETQFKKLKLDLSKVKDLDELIKKHKIFVENIKKQCLLDDDNKIIIIKISEIFDIILKFKKVFDVLYSFTYEINYENNYNFTRIKNIEEYVKQIDNLYSEYKNKIIEFIQILELLGKNNIKYLAMKLDYNYYYSLLEKEKNDEKDLKNIKNINKENIRQKILADLDYQNELSENSKNNYNDSNNIIDNNKFKEEKLNSIQNSKINEDQLKEEDEKINDEENEEIKAQENDNYNNQINLFENNEFNKEKENLNKFNINKNEDKDDKLNNLIYIKKRYKDNNIANNINLNSSKNDNTINKNQDTNQNINTKEEDFQKGSLTYQYEINNSKENELNNENNENNDSENNMDEIDDDEDKIVTNIIPKVYGVSSKGKFKNEEKDKNDK